MAARKSACSHKNPIETNEDSKVCADCGLVMEQQQISVEQEWRTFAPECTILFANETNMARCEVMRELSPFTKRDLAFERNLDYFLEFKEGIFKHLKGNILTIHEKLKTKTKGRCLTNKKINVNRCEYVIAVILYYWSCAITKHSQFPLSLFKLIYPSFERHLVFSILKQLGQRKLCAQMSAVEYKMPQSILLQGRLSEYLSEIERSYMFQRVYYSSLDYLAKLQLNVKIVSSRRIDTQINLAIFLSLVDADLLECHKSTFFKNKLTTILEIFKKNTLNFLSAKCEAFLAKDSY